MQRRIVETPFGHRLRQLREGRGLTLRGLGRAVPCTHVHIRDLELGNKAPSPTMAARLDLVLGAAGELKVLAVEPAGQQRPRVARVEIASRPTPHDLAIRAGESLACEGDPVQLIDRLTRDDLLMDRRQAVHSIGGTVFGAALLDRLDSWLMPAQKRQRQRATRALSDADVQQLEQTAKLFCLWDDQFGGGLRRKAVIGQLSEIAELLKESHGPPIDQRLYLVMAQLAKTAATMTWDSGRGTTNAQQYYILALQAAKEGGDRAFGASVLASMARQLLYLDRAYEAAELVRLALEGSAGLAPATLRAMLHTREAWAYAKQGRLAAFRRATDKAQNAHDGAGSHENHYWIDYFDGAELAGVTGGRLLELAHHDPALAGEAADHIQRAVQLRGPHHLRSLALDKVGVAEARLLQRELEEAARLGHEAAETAERTASERVRVKLAEFYQLTYQHRRIPAVLALRDRVRPLLDPPSSDRPNP